MASRAHPIHVPADPEIRVTAIPGADEDGAAWTIRTILPIDGDEAAKARWCHERNTDLLLAAEPSMELMAFGGWGLSVRRGVLFDDGAVTADRSG